MDSIKSRMDEDGVVVIENFLSEAEADELRAAGEELEAKRPEDLRSEFGDHAQHKDTYFLESNDKIRYFLERNAKDGERPRLNKVGHALHWLHPLFRFYTYNDRVKQTCQNLGMRDPAVVQSMIVYKSAGVGGEVTPHQDATYLSTDPQTAVGFWVPLVDATLDNGCLWVAKGSHRSGTHRRLVRNADKDAAELLVYDRPPPVYPASNFAPLAVPKGTCILLHGNVLHKSAPNKSPFDRPAYTFHVVERTAAYSPDNWLQEGPGAPFAPLYTTSQHCE